MQSYKGHTPAIATRLDDRDIITDPKFLSGIRFQNYHFSVQTPSTQKKLCNAAFKETLDFNVSKKETIIYTLFFGAFEYVETI